jgi:hypothetical protein
VPMLSYISVYGRTPAKGDSACQGQAWYTGVFLLVIARGLISIVICL